MDIIGIIGTIIEFSQKHEEFSDEIKTVRATLASLHLITQKVNIKELPSSMSDVLESTIEETGSLLTKVSAQKRSSFWTSIMNMLPGSDLQKLKEKNQQLLHLIDLLNLHLNTRASYKRQASSTSIEETEELCCSKPVKKVKIASSFGNSDEERARKAAISQLLELNKVEEEIKAEQKEEISSESAKTAFKLKLLCNKRVGKTLSQKIRPEPVIVNYWDDEGKAVYDVQRINFPDLPAMDLQKISKDHASIVGTRQRKLDIKGTMEEGEKKEEGQTGTDEALAAKGENASSPVDENGQDDKERKYEYKFILKDQSLNGTFYLKNYELGEVSLEGVEITGNFKMLKRGAEMVLEHGDVIGIVMQKPRNEELIFGFQFLMH